MAKDKDTLPNRATAVQRKARLRKSYANETNVQKMFIIGQSKKKK